MISLTASQQKLAIGAKYTRLNCINTLLDCLAEFEISPTTTVESFVDDDNDNDNNNNNNDDDHKIEEMKLNKDSFINIYPEFIGELISGCSETNFKLEEYH